MPPRTSPLPWVFFGLLSAAALVLNWLWEMAQMPAYAEMAGRPWLDTLLPCTRASLGDVALTLAVCGIGALISGRWLWAAQGTWNVYAGAALLGAILGAATECRLLASGRWSYTGRMPVVPVLGVGLWPLLQLTLLTPIALWIAGRLTGAATARPSAAGRQAG